MLKKFNNFFRQQNNDKGMTIATVIIAIGFVLVLVSVLLSSTAINFKMRSMNEFSKDAFYSAEQVLDEINVGLQELVSDAISASYSNVLSNYDTDGMSASAKNENVKGEFYGYIEDKLGLDTANNTYMAMPVDNNVAKDTRNSLYGFLKESTRWHDKGTSESYGAFLRSAAQADGNFAKAAAADGTEYYTGKMLYTNKDGIYIKDLVVYYRDSNGFVSTIRTDIHILFPELSFSDTTVPNINSYAFITDTCLKIENKGKVKSGASVITVEGDSYAYSVDATGATVDYKATGTGANTHIVATDFEMHKGNLMTYDTTNLWLGDMVAESSDVTYAGNTYVLDDTNMKGKNGKLYIGGYYTGYGNSVKDEHESSAILINGTNVSVDMQYVKGLSLAGRAFVGIKSDHFKADEGKVEKNPNKVVDDKDATTFDVFTGESVGVKPNQLMYLVPSECIGVNSKNISKYDRNPMPRADYDSMIELTKSNDEEEHLTEVSLNLPVAKLGGTTLGDYLDENDPVRKVFIRSSDGSDNTFVYYYMNFKDESAANTYFAKYYNLNKESVDKYMKIYLDAIKFPATEGASLRVSMAANAVEDIEEEREVAPYLRVPTQVDADGNPISIEASFGMDYETLSSQFLGYCTKLSPDLQGLHDREEVLTEREGDNKAVFLNLVNEGMLKEMTNGGTETYTDGTNKALLIYRDSVDTVYNLSTSDLGCNLIVANCSLTVPSGSEFKGTMIAKGTIEVVGGTKFTFRADSKAVDKCMILKSEDDVYMFAEVFNDADELSFMAGSSEKTGNIEVTDLVQFSNWTKNVTIEKK